MVHFNEEEKRDDLSNNTNGTILWHYSIIDRVAVSSIGIHADCVNSLRFTLKVVITRNHH